MDITSLLDRTQGTGIIVWACLILLLAWLLSSILTRLLRSTEWAKAKVGRKVDRTVLRFAIHLKTVLVFLIAALVFASIIPGLRSVFGTILASAGVTALVIGFAAKSTLANLISGMTLAAYRPVRIGDKVTVEGEYGEIEDITLRHTIVRTWEHKRLVIPNEKLDNMSLINYSLIDPTMLCRVEVRVSYDTDLSLAQGIIVDEAMTCPHRDLSQDAPWTRVVEHLDYGVSIRIYMWVSDIDNAWQGRFWLLEHVKTRLANEGIEIPVPYRTLQYKSDLPPARHSEAED